MPLKSGGAVQNPYGKGRTNQGLISVGGEVTCDINIEVQKDSTPDIHIVVIDGNEYYDGEVASLAPGTYDLSWLSGNGGIFSSWGVSGNISVEDPNAETTTLTVTCGGTLTLNMVECPSGEQLTNPGWELGDFTGWTKVGDHLTITTLQKHTGSYSLDMNDGSAKGEYVEQAVEIHVACVDEFYIWKRGMCPVSPPSGSRTKITIFYTDDTTTVVEHETIRAENGLWVQIDLKPYLEAGKIISKVRIERDDDYGGWYQQIDDASLTGTG